MFYLTIFTIHFEPVLNLITGYLASKILQLEGHVYYFR